MRPLTDQVDEFIEGFFDGSIISMIDYMVDLSKKKPMLARMDKKIIEGFDAMSDKLRLELIPRYLRTKGTEKELVAEAIFIQVIELRYTGFIKNNPDTLKETTYWKNRCLTVELESNHKDAKIGELIDNITKLRVGSGGIK